MGNVPVCILVFIYSWNERHLCLINNMDCKIYISGEYDKNLCNPGDMKCESCPKRLPSCRSLPDGDEAVQSALWTDLYVTCLLNRTMAVRHCPNGQVFDPNQLHCVSKIPKGQ